MFTDKNRKLQPFIQELVNYFNDFPIYQTILISNNKSLNIQNVKKLTYTNVSTNLASKSITFFDLNTINGNIPISNYINNSFLSILIGYNIDLDEHNKFLKANKLQSKFVGRIPHNPNSTISFHGNCINIDSQTYPLKKILAVISTYNDEDIIGQVLNYLVTQDVDILVLENWSTDNTEQIIKKIISTNSHNIFLEKFPNTGPVKNHLWPDILNYKVNNNLSNNYDWIIHYDSDEIRQGPSLA